MRRLISWIVLVEFLFIACTVLPIQAQEPNNPPVRKVHRRTGVPITSLLRSSEKRLTVLLNKSPSIPAEPPDGMSQAEWLTQGADVVMRARIESTEATLTPDQDWIKTSIHAKVLQVLKSTGPRSFFEGQEISFLEEGGDLDLGGRQIEATVEWADRFQVGREYLIFAVINSANELLVSAGSTYEIVSGKALRSLLKPMGQLDTISKSSVNSILKDIQRNREKVEE